MIEHNEKTDSIQSVAIIGMGALGLLYDKVKKMEAL